LRHYPRAAWINPRDSRFWPHTASLKLVDRLMGGRMYPLSLDGIDRALRELRHRR